jgi:hypothetical protein
VASDIWQQENACMKKRKWIFGGNLLFVVPLWAMIGFSHSL